MSMKGSLLHSGSGRHMTDALWLDVDTSEPWAPLMTTMRSHSLNVHSDPRTAPTVACSGNSDSHSHQPVHLGDTHSQGDCFPPSVEEMKDGISAIYGAGQLFMPQLSTQAQLTRRQRTGNRK